MTDETIAGNSATTPSNSAPSTTTEGAEKIVSPALPAEGGLQDDNSQSDSFGSDIFEFDGDEGADTIKIPGGTSASPPAPPPAEQGAPQPPVQEVAPQVPPQQPAEQQVQQPPAEQPAQPTPAPSAPGSEVQPEASVPLSPGDMATALVADRANQVKALADNLYKLTPEEVSALEENATDHVPTMLAKVHMNAVTTALFRMQEYVPIMVQQILAQRAKGEEAINAFFSANKGLSPSNAKHMEVVQRYAKAFRAANPQASREQFIQTVGMLACNELQISPNGGQPQAPAPTMQGNQPVAPVPPAFQPAMNGRGIPPSPSPGSPFDVLGMDFDGS